MAKYHFRLTEKTTNDPEFLNDILSKGKYMSLALCRDNEPYIVTLSYGYDCENNSIFCHCARKGLKLDIIRSNNKICGTVFLDEGYIQGECGQPYRSVVFRGIASEITKLDEKKHAMSVLLNHLEDDSSIIRDKKLKEDNIYNSFGILRIDIADISGKKGR
ncbi:MAG: flavin-nucleotide-binding protein [Candidatus Latescibacteria bacterium]|jgi:uncharacterized protein|nr:flavin-nucleotide-binding protein [Candidatus Latescibacterota bacterium]